MEVKDTVMPVEGIIILSHMNPEIIEGIIKDILGKQAEISFKVGMEKVVEWIDANPVFIQSNTLGIKVPIAVEPRWQAFKKENGLEAHQ